MDDNNATLESDEALGIETPEQPTSTEAVETSPVSTTAKATDAPADGQPAVDAPVDRKWAGKYTRPEELEEGYLNAQREASRMAQELARLKGKEEATSKSAETPQYTPEQLESWKEARLLEQSESQAAKLLAQSQGDHETARRYEATAREAARQLRMIDKELRKLDYTSYTREAASRAAEDTLQVEAREVWKQYETELVPGNPLFEKAAVIHHGLLSMGYKDSPVLQAQAVAMAAQRLGRVPTQSVQVARQELAQGINKALRAGVPAGAGKATAKSTAAPDFLAMSDDEFNAYKRKRGIAG